MAKQTNDHPPGLPARMVETRGRKRTAEETAAKDPSKRRKKIDYDEIFVVLVGEEKTRFEVHRNVLTQRTCAPDKFREGKEKIIRLPEQDAKTFGIYLQWLYTSKIFVSELENAVDIAVRAGIWEGISLVQAVDEDIEDAIVRVETEDEKKSEEAARLVETAVLDLIKLYAMADYLNDTSCRNAILDRFLGTYACIGRAPAASIVASIYNLTLRRCQPRRAAVELYVFMASSDYVDELLRYLKQSQDVLPGDFWFDFALASARAILRPQGSPVKAERCYYHEHDGDVPQCSPLVNPVTASQIRQAQADGNLGPDLKPVP
ncbi:hypothetical protein CLAFUR0_13482 [Fulvia fulva]|nr:hypothetical protein CLAFUR0_13482 [Fulvia fulva]